MLLFFFFTGEIEFTITSTRIRGKSLKRGYSFVIFHKMPEKSPALTAASELTPPVTVNGTINDTRRRNKAPIRTVFF